MTVTKVVVNNNGRSKGVADFPLFVSGSSTTSVISGATNVFPAPATYTITETSDPNYVQTFSLDCDAVNGTINLAPGENKFCIITNTDSGGSRFVPPPV
ncbi:MAG: hypothetical protein NTZ42_02765, partial [Candidatus Gribaldobacteria bacterium]|nr:hypothetical protein [Candidatus Gribaldobacteria bacterium]